MYKRIFFSLLLISITSVAGENSDEENYREYAIEMSKCSGALVALSNHARKRGHTEMSNLFQHNAETFTFSAIAIFSTLGLSDEIALKTSKYYHDNTKVFVAADIEQSFTTHGKVLGKAEELVETCRVRWMTIAEKLKETVMTGTLRE